MAGVLEHLYMCKWRAEVGVRSDNHEAALGLLFAHNFVSRYTALKTTPMVGAGIADDRWTVEQLVERTAGYNLPKLAEWERFLDTLPDGE